MHSRRRASNGAVRSCAHFFPSWFRVAFMFLFVSTFSTVSTNILLGLILAKAQHFSYFQNHLLEGGDCGGAFLSKIYAAPFRGLELLSGRRPPSLQETNKCTKSKTAKACLKLECA